MNKPPNKTIAVIFATIVINVAILLLHYRKSEPPALESTDCQHGWSKYDPIIQMSYQSFGPAILFQTRSCTNCGIAQRTQILDLK